MFGRSASKRTQMCGPRHPDATTSLDHLANSKFKLCSYSTGYVQRRRDSMQRFAFLCTSQFEILGCVVGFNHEEI